MLMVDVDGWIGGRRNFRNDTCAVGPLCTIKFSGGTYSAINSRWTMGWSY